MSKQLTFLLLVTTSSFLALAQEQTELKKQVEDLKSRIVALEKLKHKKVIKDNELVYSEFPQIEFRFDSAWQITIPKKLRPGDFYQIRVTGINLNQYRLVVESDDTISSSPLNFPTFGTLDLSGLTSLISSIPVSTSSTGTTKSTEEALLPNRSTREQINLKVLLMNEFSKNIKERLQAILEDVEDKKFSYASYRILRQSGMNADKYEPDVRRDLKQFAEYRSTLKILKDSTAIITESFNKFLDEGKVKVFLAEASNIDVKGSVEVAKKALTEASSSTTKAISLISTEKIEKQLRSVLNLYKDNTYTSLPIQLNGEQAEIDIRFIPKDSASGLQPYTLSTIKIPQRRWYWSVGPAIYYSSLRNERLGTETILNEDSVQRFTIFEESDLNSEIGAALLLRGGIKVADYGLGVHASVGTGLSLGDEVQPRMLFGAGVTYGQVHSLSVDLGGIAGYVKRISDGADFQNEYVEKPSLLVNALRLEYFVSVGYAFRF